MERKDTKEFKEEETIAKTLSKGQVVTVPINGKEKKIFWANTVFSSCVYYRAYTKRNVNEAVNIGMLDTLHNREKTKVEGDDDYIILEQPSALDDTVSIKIDGVVVMPDKFTSASGVLRFDHTPKQEIEIEYDYYEPSIYSDIVNNASTCMLIYLSVREEYNHAKKVFESPEVVGEMTENEASEIISVYLDKS
jgi:hypothetical protein